ncbi:hypothetical protein NMY22_g8516 [Coprinellus aureogranulatus]|nr:hypothetical protein NMY22_g8516 [Coprinellus aureogranulatus]
MAHNGPGELRFDHATGEPLRFPPFPRPSGATPKIALAAVVLAALGPSAPTLLPPIRTTTVVVPALAHAPSKFLQSFPHVSRDTNCRTASVALAAGASLRSANVKWESTGKMNQLASRPNLVRIWRISQKYQKYDIRVMWIPRTYRTQPFIQPNASEVSEGSELFGSSEIKNRDEAWRPSRKPKLLSRSRGLGGLKMIATS